MFSSVNPFTGALVGQFPPHTPAQVEAKLTSAWQVFGDYRRTSFAERAKILNRAADILCSRKHQFASTITEEMGKNLAEAEGEVAKCALVCRYYAQNAEAHLSPEPVATESSRSFVAFQPLGPVLAIMPWNFPFWQVFRFAAPALMAGNTGLLKHAANVPRCALAIEDIFREAGLPEGVFGSLLIESARVEPLIKDWRVKAVTITGSEPAGRAVAAQAGEAIKKVVLELGGSDPFIIMPSAPLDEAVRAGIRSRIICNGQSCIAAKRIIIHESVYQHCEAQYVEGMKALQTGDPTDRQTQLGPLATEKQISELEAQVERAVKAGAKVLTGGKRGIGRNVFEPTVLVDVPRQSPVFREEFFGPVAMLFKASSVDHAIEIANDSPFGLGASAWTEDRGEQERFIEDLESGQVFLNAIVASDPRMPFGGVKNSGVGRELGQAGIREFVNQKSVWCR